MAINQEQTQGERAYHMGRSAYELTKVPNIGWTLFGDLPVYTQAYWIAQAALVGHISAIEEPESN